MRENKNETKENWNGLFTTPWKEVGSLSAAALLITYSQTPSAPTFLACLVPPLAPLGTPFFSR